MCMCMFIIMCMCVYVYVYVYNYVYVYVYVYVYMYNYVYVCVRSEWSKSNQRERGTGSACTPVRAEREGRAVRAERERDGQCVHTCSSDNTSLSLGTLALLSNNMAFLLNSTSCRTCARSMCTQYVHADSLRKLKLRNRSKTTVKK